ncbi:MAG TPA: YceI family protein [Dehalococcoidia bacterium]|nr:YceI family protein [Dehalococcoidia bacterium]
MFPFNRVQNPKTRKLAYIAAGLVALAVVAIVIGYVVLYAVVSDDPNLAETAPPIPTAVSGARKPSLPSGTTVLHFVVDKGSSAKYVAREQLSFAPVPTTAVGETKDVTGDIYLTRLGLAPGQKSSFKVDLRTITSDESLRDRAMKGVNALATDRFPFAEFVIESVPGFPTDYSPDKEVQLTMTGSLTLRETTKPVTWNVHARSSGDYLTAIADIDLKMTDFGITPPVASNARVEDGVHLQVTLYAKLAN